jgi:hypothetical protein
MAVTNFSNANVAIFKLISGGVAYDITLPFEADSIEWVNYSTYGTDSETLQGIWFNGYPAGDASIITRGTTDLTSVAEGTNGITQLDDGSGFADNHRTPTAITAASPAVVTCASHGLTTGQFVRATNFRATPVADATGMYSLNNQLFQVSVLSANTFALYYPNTNLQIPVDTSAETAFVNNGIARFTLVGQSLYTQNPAPVYQYTLGTAVMGNDGDVLYIRAIKANQYTDLGDVGA